MLCGKSEEQIVLTAVRTYASWKGGYSSVTVHANTYRAVYRHRTRPGGWFNCCYTIYCDVIVLYHQRRGTKVASSSCWYENRKTRGDARGTAASTPSHTMYFCTWQKRKALECPTCTSKQRSCTHLHTFIFFQRYVLFTWSITDQQWTTRMLRVYYQR